jgi:hypothetical protein
LRKVDDGTYYAVEGDDGDAVRAVGAATVVVVVGARDCPSALQPAPDPLAAAPPQMPSTKTNQKVSVLAWAHLWREYSTRATNRKERKKKTAGKTREEEEEPHSPKSPALQMAMST